MYIRGSKHSYCRYQNKVQSVMRFGSVRCGAVRCDGGESKNFWFAVAVCGRMVFLQVFCGGRGAVMLALRPECQKRRERTSNASARTISTISIQSATSPLYENTGVLVMQYGARKISCAKTDVRRFNFVIWDSPHFLTYRLFSPSRIVNSCFRSVASMKNSYTLDIPPATTSIAPSYWRQCPGFYYVHFLLGIRNGRKFGFGYSLSSGDLSPSGSRFTCIRYFIAILWVLVLAVDVCDWFINAANVAARPHSQQRGVIANFFSYLETQFGYLFIASVTGAFVCKAEHIQENANSLCRLVTMLQVPREDAGALLTRKNKWKLWAIFYTLKAAIVIRFIRGILKAMRFSRNSPALYLFWSIPKGISSGKSAVGMFLTRLALIPFVSYFCCACMVYHQCCKDMTKRIQMLVNDAGSDHSMDFLSKLRAVIRTETELIRSLEMFNKAFEGTAMFLVVNSLLELTSVTGKGFVAHDKIFNSLINTLGFCLDPLRVLILLSSVVVCAIVVQEAVRIF